MPEKKAAAAKSAKKKKAAAKKKPAPAKKAPAAKKTPAKKTSPAKKAALKKSPAKTKSAAAKKTARKAPAKKKAAGAKSVAQTKKAAKKATASRKKAAGAKLKKVSPKAAAAKGKEETSRPSGPRFSLEEALAAAKNKSSEEDKLAARKAAKERERQEIEAAEHSSEKRVFGAASLDEILGRSATPKKTTPQRDVSEAPKKHRKYYKLLLELRDHVYSGLNMHTQDTLKRSSKDDAGDLSGYSQHMADAGTDTFDRDFALSMVSNEQEALQEIEAAIDRIFKGAYGICEMTGKKIQEERLLAVPFTRYSVETQTQLEKNKRYSSQRGGIFADASGDEALSFGDENPDA